MLFNRQKILMNVGHTVAFSQSEKQNLTRLPSSAYYFTDDPTLDECVNKYAKNIVISCRINHRFSIENITMEKFPSLRNNYSIWKLIMM